MKNYEKPVIEVTVISNTDVITASGGFNFTLAVNNGLEKGENVVDF